MPTRKQDAHRALELLEEYRKRLAGTDNQPLRDALTKAIVAIRSKLFQALLDIHQFYTVTLEDSSKNTDSKIAETLKLAERWESHSAPVPAEVNLYVQKTLSPVAPHNGLDEADSSKARSGGGVATENVDVTKQRTPGNETEFTVILEKKSGGLGISIAGGVDNPHTEDHPGIFITKIIPETVAEQDGRLRLGDQIVSVNGDSLEEVNHAQAVDALKRAGNHVTLVIRRVEGREWSPVLTLDRRTTQKVVEVPSPARIASPAPVVPTSPIRAASPVRVVDIILVKNAKGLGFSIAGGCGNQHVLGDDGIFVTKIIPGGAAEENGILAIGDRILEVNSNSMVSITHEDAVRILKSTQEKVMLKVEKNAISSMGAMSPVLSTTAPAKGSATRTVVLNRPVGTGLGFNIIGGEAGTGIFISLISPNGVADKSNQLAVGDQILEVNHQDIRSATHEEAAITLKNAGTVVTLLVEYRPEDYSDFQNKLRRSQDEAPASPMTAPSPSLKPTVVKQLYVRALFDYDSSKDDDRPSQGLSFKHGDILHILNGSDDEWWQAAAVNSQAIDGTTGLVPSKKRIERRARANQKNVKFTKAPEPSGLDRKTSGSRRSSFKLSMKLPFIKKVSEASVTSAAQSEEPKSVEEEHIPTYEPVKLEQRGYARPVIILGPLKEEINDMLVQEFPDKFAGCVPHTTRPPRDGEVNGKDYHFVQSVEQMEKDIQAHLFIEAGRYKDNLYGTSIKAVQEVAEQGKHCILGVSGYAIRRLQMADLHPIAICIRPNTWEVIHTVSKGTQEQCQQTLEKGVKIEQEFVEYFTSVVSGDSVNDIYTAVKNVIQDQSGSHIWVPTNEPLP